MKRRGRRADRSVRVFPNDPDASVGLIEAHPLRPLPGEPPFVIEGRRYAPAPYEPGTLAFQYWQGEISLVGVIRMFEDLFDRDFTTWQAGRPLRVKLRAGRDLNAFYDRASLQFFYDVDKVTGRTVYAGESLDILAHETGHAILDVYQPGYWSTPDLETAAFHEAFADCAALLATLTEPAVRRAFLEEAGRPLTRSNLVSRLAESLGRAIHDNYGPEAASDPTRLRDARNRFRYRAPDRLKPRAADSVLSSEPHSFSRVFTGAFYDFLVGLCAGAIERDGDDAAVDRARRLAGRLLARAVETLPPGQARFRTVARRMREIDQEEEGGQGSIALEEAFAAHGMKLPPFTARQHPRGRQASRGKGRTESRSAALGGGTPRSSYRLLRALDPDRPGGMAALRAALGLPPGCPLRRTRVRRHIGGGTREQLTHDALIAVEHPSLGALSGVLVTRSCGCTLTRDPSGDVEGVAIAPWHESRPEELVRQIRAWVARGEIEKDRGARSRSREHFRRGVPFRVTASFRLERVYFD